MSNPRKYYVAHVPQKVKNICARFVTFLRNLWRDA